MLKSVTTDLYFKNSVGLLPARKML